MALAKILSKKAQQKKIKKMVDRIVESYDNFALVEASDVQIASIKKEGYQVVPLPLDQMGIKIGSITINTGEPRIDKTGAIKAHPAYAHQKEPGSSKHH